MKVKYYWVYAIVAATLFCSCNGQTAEQKVQSTVSVSGTGTVSVTPDMIRMSVSVSKTSPTTRQAQETVSKTTARILEILKEEGVDGKSTGTASLQFNPEYEWRRNSQVLLGQRAEQTVTFSVENIIEDADRAPRIIDRLTQINGIILNGVDFDVKDRSAYFTRSRELAFQKAIEKAEQYAILSGLKVTKTLSVSEVGVQPFFPATRQFTQNMVREESMKLADAASTVLPSGKMEVTATVSAVFLME